MAASIAISAFGTLLKVGDGGSPVETFATILQVQDITPPAPTLMVEDATSHDSPGGWTEDRPTLLDMGDCTFGILYVPSAATHDATTGLINDMQNRTLRNFQCVYPDTSTWAFAAYVSKFAPKAPVKGLLKADITLSISGQPILV